MTKKDRAEIFLLKALEAANRSSGYVKVADKIKARLMDMEFRAMLDEQVDEEISDYMRNYFWRNAKDGL